ncbi:hypothetical protein SEMRO_2155_G316850.1 [Seminavis robusta]|uniref:Uncharacterized protein n=1 Tax=Seminavis robusta TaxID=568900 RepID=A0A9N8EYY1_9STRA|nr:hypothetical protein SEMRO_2155_G316850.1 [Seminavis robusta]|eukprot:Sro2155_g316850.1 n/a (144) ;mRNA; f:362-793
MSRPKPKYIPFTNEEMICSIFVGTTKDEPAIGTVVNNTKILSEETQLKLQDSIDEALYGADKDATFCVTLAATLCGRKRLSGTLFSSSTTTRCEAYHLCLQQLHCAPHRQELHHHASHLRQQLRHQPTQREDQDQRQHRQLRS